MVQPSVDALAEVYSSILKITAGSDALTIRPVLGVMMETGFTLTLLDEDGLNLSIGLCLIYNIINFVT